MLAAIWAEDQNHLIGKQQGLPWSLPADLKHFKETTMGHAILMGRTTFEGMGGRVLPGRTTLVLTRDTNYQVDHPAVLVFHEVSEVLKWYHGQEKNLYITGGAQVYESFSPYVEMLIKTEIEGIFEGDTYFPECFDSSEFEEVSASYFPKDENNAYGFWVNVLSRKGQHGT